MNSKKSLRDSLPNIKDLFKGENKQHLNDKYDIFDGASLAKEHRVQRLSVTNRYDNELENNGGVSRVSNMFYQQFMYNTSSDDKKRRLDEFRTMGAYSEVERALTEMCNEFFETDDKGRSLKIRLHEEHNTEVQTLIEEEFYRFIEIYKFDERGSKYIREWLTEGELFFENIVSVKKPELGIIGTTRVAADRCDPLYYDLDNELIDCFILREKSPDKYPFQWGNYISRNGFGNKNQNQLLFLNEKQMTYIANDQWTDGKRHRSPTLSFAQRPYRQLTMTEDATVMYMMARAPERLMFSVDVGNMSPSKAEQYMKRLAGQFWSKKTVAPDGRLENVLDPQGMLENYWFPMREGGKGSDVKSIGGGKASPDNLEILTFFVQKLYQSLKVPLSRLNSETAFNDSASITREELCFAEYIINMQKLWASAIKTAFIVHLKLKGKRTLHVAKKLGIDDVRGPSNEFRVSQVYKDHFTNKCWDNYDVLTEAINNRLAEVDEAICNEKEQNLLEMENLRGLVDKVTQGLITESVDCNEAVLTEQIHILLEQLNAVEGRENANNDMKSDMMSWWEQYDLRDEDIHIKFVEPSQFFALREQQLFQLKYDNFNNMSQNEMVSTTLAQKMYLGWTDREILANLDMLKKDAAFRWELGQIDQNGPNFREKAITELENTMAAGSLGGGMMGGEGPPLPDGASPEGGDVGGGDEAGGPAGDASTTTSSTSVPSFGPPVSGGGNDASGG